MLRMFDRAAVVDILRERLDEVQGGSLGAAGDYAWAKICQ